MAENRLGIGRIAFPQSLDVETLLALEEFNRKTDDNINYLMKPNIITASTNYSASDLDYTILCSAALTVTLPQASTVRGKAIIIKRVGAGAVIVDGYSSETIDGSATVTLTTAYESVRVHSDGSNWYKI
jgi:hypothetical protein